MTNIPKFRAWLKEEEQMVDVVCLDIDRDQIWFEDVLCERVYGNSEHLILMQSTGLHDKNGVEIFCDDIIRITDNHINISVHQVVWGKDYPAFDLLPEFHPTCNGLSWILGENVPFEVIRNIHQKGYLINDD